MLVKAEAVADLVAPVVMMVGRKDRALADQIRRATQAVVLALAEGWQVSGGNQRVHFERAAGSNAEVRAALRMAARWGYVDRERVVAIDALGDEVAAMVWRLLHPRSAVHQTP